MTSLVGALAFAIIAVSMTLGSSIRFPGLGIVIATPLAAAIAGATIGALCGMVIGRLLLNHNATIATPDISAAAPPPPVKLRSSYSQVPRARFEQEWTTTNLG